MEPWLNSHLDRKGPQTSALSYHCLCAALVRTNSDSYTCCHHIHKRYLCLFPEGHPFRETLVCIDVLHPSRAGGYDDCCGPSKGAQGHCSPLSPANLALPCLPSWRQQRSYSRTSWIVMSAVSYPADIWTGGDGEGTKTPVVVADGGGLPLKRSHTSLRLTFASCWPW